MYVCDIERTGEFDDVTDKIGVLADREEREWWKWWLTRKATAFGSNDKNSDEKIFERPDISASKKEQRYGNKGERSFLIVIAYET